MTHTKPSRRGAQVLRLLPVLCLSLALVAAVVFAVCFGIRSSRLSQQLDALQQQLSQAQAQLSDAQKQVTDLQGQVTDLQGQLAGKDDAGSSSGDSGSGTGNGTTLGTGSWDTQGSVESDGPAYQKLYPDFYAAQPYNATTVVDNVIYLTFDDGPSERTDEILDTLKQEGIKATFFVLHQKNTEASAARMKRIVAEGHTLAIHTYSHVYKDIYASVEAYLEDAYKMYTEIKEVTGVAPSLFRCPGGSRNSYNKATADAILAEMQRRGFVCHDWNLSVEDAVNPPKTADEIVEFVMGYVGNKTRGIVLMHDSKARTSTAEALPELISRFRNLGFTFDRLTPDIKPYLFSKK